jgi:hypothetical protein
MDQAAIYDSWKPTVLGKVIGDGECVSLVVNNERSYIEALWPAENWTSIISPVASAKQLATAGNPDKLHWIENDHNNPNQLPVKGDIMVFDATPQAGYSNTFENPDGHAGICGSASASGYALLQQNSPNSGSPVNVSGYAWKFRPCLGWFHIVGSDSPAPSAPSPASTGKSIFLPPTTGPWHLYNEDGPYDPSNAANVKGTIVPSQFGGLTYAIVADKGNGVYVIDTQMFGRGAIWTSGSDIVIK